MVFQCGHCKTTFGKNKTLRQHVKVKHAGVDLLSRFWVGRKAKRSVPTRSVEDEHAPTADFGMRNLPLAVLVAECNCARYFRDTMNSGDYVSIIRGFDNPRVRHGSVTNPNPKP